MSARNQPCYCGSGKKYKKCCLAKDEQEKTAKLMKSREPKVAIKNYVTELYDELVDMMRGK